MTRGGNKRTGAVFPSCLGEEGGLKRGSSERGLKRDSSITKVSPYNAKCHMVKCLKCEEVHISEIIESPDVTLVR